MGRLPLVDPGDVGTSSLAREALAAAWAAQGRSVDPNVYRALASHPRALRKLMEFGTVVYFDNSMTPAQRELAYLTASLTNDCRH
jgi:alkylhydroperoxidase family enzyme